MSKLVTQQKRQLDLFTIAPGTADIRSKQVRDLCAWGFFNISNHRRNRIRHEQGNLFVDVSARGDKGIATYHDNDILIFLTSILVYWINDGKDIGRNIFFSANEFWDFSGREAKGGYRYELIWDALSRLHETSIHTNISIAGGIDIEEKWNWLSYIKRAKSLRTGKTIGFEVEVSKAIFNSINQTVPQVLTLHHNYFSIRSGFVKWLYLYARRCCGTDGRDWIAKESLLHSLSGSAQSIKDFRKMLKHIMISGELLEYDLIEAYEGRERAILFRRKKTALDKQYKSILLLE
jgi:plasmid replication initiation protein